MSRTRLAMFAATIGFGLFARIPNASAQAAVVTDPMLLEQSIAQKLKQIEQYKNQLEGYELAVRDHLAPAAWVWDQSQIAIDQVLQLVDFVNAARNGAINVDDYLSRFRTIDYYRSSPCFKRGGCPKEERDLLIRSREWAANTQKSANEVIFEALDKEYEQLARDADKLRNVQRQARNSKGQLQALGYANQLASAQAAQLIQIRGLLVTQQKALLVEKQARADREAQEAAAAEHLRSGKFAGTDSSGIFDKVLSRFHDGAEKWSAYLTTCATFLFGSLALISLVFTFLKWRNDIGEALVEMARFAIVTGFYWWLLLNSTQISSAIYASMRMMAGNAAGLGANLSPSAVVDVGFSIFQSVIDNSSVLSPVDTAVSYALGIAVLLCLASISVNMVLVLISGWILGYAGIFFLGFGGSRWTSDIAITYYKAVLGLGAEAFGMILVVGIGKGFLDDYHLRMEANPTFTDLAVMLVVSLILLKLATKVPSLLAGIVSGAGLKGGGTDIGAGTSALGVAAMSSAAISAGSKSLIQTGLTAAGGLTAVAAAMSAASNAVAATANSGFGGGGGASGSGGSAQSGATPFAEAAGFSDTTASGSGSPSAGGGAAPSSELSTAGSLPGIQEGASKGPNDSAGSETGKAGEGTSSTESSVVGSTGEGGAAASGSEGQTDRLDSKADNLGASGGSAGAASAGKSAEPMSSARKAARVAGGAASLLGKASYGMAKGAVVDFKNSLADRVADTTGGKLASAIRDGQAGSLSGGKGDMQNEVDAFVNQDAKSG